MSDDSTRPQFQPPAFQPPAAPTPAGGPAFGVPTSGEPAFGAPAGGPPFEPGTVPLQSSPPERKRPKGKIIGAGVAVVAIVAAGVFAITKISDNSTKGGAASPTEAGKDFAKALNDEDVLGVVDLLLPGERETFRQPMLDLVDNLKRLQVLSNDADPSNVPGFDINITNVIVSVDPPVAEDIDSIRLTGTDESTVDGTKLPIGDLIVREALDGEQPDATEPATGKDLDWQITTVEKDGRWYVSLFYSVAEQIRLEKAASKDVPTAPLALAGADAPEAAVDQMAKALTKLDLPTIIGGLNPNEAEALQRYAPIFLDRANNRVADLDATISLTNTTYGVTGSGSHRNVTIQGFDLKVAADDQDATVSLKDGCLTVAASDTTYDSCTDGKDIDKSLTDLGVQDDPDISALVTSFTDAFADFKSTGIAVDQVGGKWFVSPIGTGTDFLDAVLKALDEDEISDIIAKAKTVATDVSNGDIALPGFGSTTVCTSGSSSNGCTSTDDTTGTDDTVSPDDTAADTVPDDTVHSNGTAPDTAADDTVPSVSVSPGGFKNQTEDFIESAEVTDQVGTQFSGAACDTPTSTDVDTMYTCTADDPDGATYDFEVRIEGPSSFVIDTVRPA